MAARSALLRNAVRKMRPALGCLQSDAGIALFMGELMRCHSGSLRKQCRVPLSIVEATK
jgi:hypothetical protein